MSSIGGSYFPTISNKLRLQLTVRLSFPEYVDIWSTKPALYVIQFQIKHPEIQRPATNFHQLHADVLHCAPPLFKILSHYPKQSNAHSSTKGQALVCLHPFGSCITKVHCVMRWSFTKALGKLPCFACDELEIWQLKVQFVGSPWISRARFPTF